MALETVDYGIIRVLSGLTVEVDPGPGEILAGTVTLSPPPPNDSVPQGYYWKVTALTTRIVGSPGSANIVHVVFDLDPTLTTGPVPISKTIDGTLDVNDTCQLIIPGGASVFFQWLNVPPLCRCAARCQYELVTKTGAAATRLVMH